MEIAFTIAVLAYCARYGNVLCSTKFLISVLSMFAVTFVLNIRRSRLIKKNVLVTLRTNAGQWIHMRP